MNLDGCYVKSFFTFILKFVVLNHAIFAGNDFRYRVGEVRTLAYGKVIFDDAGLAVSADGDQASGMRSYGLVCRRNEEQIDGGIQLDAARNLDEGSVFQKGSIERDERFVLKTGVPRKVLSNTRYVIPDGGGQTARNQLIGQVARRKLRVVMSVDENDATTALLKSRVRERQLSKQFGR